MLRIDHLNKSYGSRPALSDVSTRLRPGEVCGDLATVRGTPAYKAAHPEEYAEEKTDPTEG